MELGSKFGPLFGLLIVLLKRSDWSPQPFRFGPSLGLFSVAQKNERMKPI